LFVEHFEEKGIAALGSERIKQLNGTYDSVTYRFGKGPSLSPLEVLVSDGDLYTSYKGKRRKLIPVTREHFRRENEPVATIGIVEENGEILLQGDIGNFKNRIRNKHEC
jgi:hypothetical protein